MNDSPVQANDEASRAKRRQRLLSAVFGDVLPEGTDDERPEGWGDRDERRGGSGDDDWLKDQVPPHHG